MKKRPLIILTGPTAVGKTKASIGLAKAIGGEIISADSRQTFRGLDLGSGKITPEEMQGVPHHLIDVAEPGDFFSMHDFQRLAYTAIDDIIAREKTPFLVGGTGLYVASVTEGWVARASICRSAPSLLYRNQAPAISTANDNTQISNFVIL